MKKILLLLLFIVGSLQSFALDVTTTYAAFQTVNGKTYVEVYNHFIATTLKYQMLKTTGKKVGTVRVLLLVKQGDSIRHVEKFNLTSPQTDSAMRPANFVDMKRFALAAGDYTLEASFIDDNNEKNTKTANTKIQIIAVSKTTQLSDIELVARAEATTDEKHIFYKNGFMLEPAVLNYYPVANNKLQFYCEIYDTKTLNDDAFAMRYFVERVGGETRSTEIIGTKRLKTSDIVPFFGTLDISQLPSGNYNLVVEVRNRKMELVTAQKQFFQRNNPYLHANSVVLSKRPVSEMFTKNFTIDSCNWSISGILVHLKGDEEVRARQMLQKTTDLEQKRAYLFSFWASNYPARAEAAYKEYMEVVTALDNKYTSFVRKGHESDRGRVYLQYGKPDAIQTVEAEAAAVPYEIWTYNKVTQGQSIGKFVFYNPSLAGNDFELLHTTGVRGEVTDPKWQLKIYKNSQTTDRDYINGGNVPDTMGGGGRANDFLNDN